MISASLQPGVRLAVDGPESLVVEAPGARMRLARLGPAARQLLLRLATAPLVWDSQVPRELVGTPGCDLAVAVPILNQLAGRRLIYFGCAIGERELMTASPTGGPARFEFNAECGDEQVRLSRFTYLRSRQSQLVLECPQRFLRLHLFAPEVMSLLPGLARGESPIELCTHNSACEKEEIGEVVRFLLAAGAIGVVSGAGTVEEDADPQLAQREFHDVAFHASTRQGLTDNTFGGIFPFLGRFQPAPALKPAMSANPIPLAVPDMDGVLRHDPPLARVMETRRSLRRYGEHAMAADQLGEFLYRTARARFIVPADPASGLFYEATRRTYPSGGATYDLELYITLSCCDGIAAGVYHYEPLRHALSLLNSQSAMIEALLRNARRQTGQKEVPQVLITFASRFNRLSWKYRAISYATTLKNAGVLYEAMYLVATAMNLAPCALGSGDSALFNRATGLDPMVESSVAEFILGTRSPLDLQVGPGSPGSESQNAPLATGATPSTVETTSK
jgi:SagB-type dehydrogenase family enzyme